MRDVLVIGLAIAVVLILIKVIWGSPLVSRVREGFAGSALINASTECPTGTQMYMYEGQAYCCSSSINPDADSVQQTCRAPPVPTLGGPPFTFCTLGPSSNGVQNCLELRAGLMEAEGSTQCTTALPNFVKGYPGSASANGRCCASPANMSYTDCANLTQAYCDVSAGTNYFLAPQSCQFLRLSQDTSCPTGYGITTIAGQSQFAGMTLVGCSDNGKICYPSNVLSMLDGMNMDTSSLQLCPTLQ